MGVFRNHGLDSSPDLFARETAACDVFDIIRREELVTPGLTLAKLKECL